MLLHDLVAFIHRAFCDLNPQTRFLLAPYIELMASRLEDCRSGKIRRLIVNLPPRSLKSHCVSIAFTAWLLGHNPAVQIIAASYGQDLADKLARDTRTIMEADWYRALFPTRLSARKAVNDFATTAGGIRMATSVGGVLTGRGADVIIIDDPLKPDQALSDVGRKAVNEWYDNTLLSRLNNKRTGCIIIVMQRLHQDDLVGHVLPQDDWTVLSFPAIAEEPECVRFDTPYGPRLFVRQPGEALHPERESVQEYEAMRRGSGSTTSRASTSSARSRSAATSSSANGSASTIRRIASPVPADRPELGHRGQNLRAQRLFRLHHLGRRPGQLLPHRRVPAASQLPRSQTRDRRPGGRFHADEIVIEDKSSALSSFRICRTTGS